jgi:hypothetical protein
MIRDALIRSFPNLRLAAGSCGIATFLMVALERTAA